MVRATPAVLVIWLMFSVAIVAGETSYTMVCAKGECAHMADISCKWKWKGEWYNKRPYLECKENYHRRRCADGNKFRVWDPSSSHPQCRIYSQGQYNTYYGNCFAWCGPSSSKLVHAMGYRSLARCTDLGRLDRFARKALAAVGKIALNIRGASIDLPTDDLLVNRCRMVRYGVRAGKTETGVLIKTV